MPGMVRMPRSTSRATRSSMAGSSLLSVMMYLSLEPPRPTRTRAPGRSRMASRRRFSISCLGGRCSRGVMRSVSVALRGSAAPLPVMGSEPALPPPMVL